MSLTRSRRQTLLAGAALAAAALLVIGAKLALEKQWPIPSCGFKSLTGLPCASCGLTRALGAVGRLDFIEAFRLNPLVTLSLMILLLVGTAVLVRPDATWPRVRRAGIWLTTKWGLLLVISLVLANWIYLLAARR